MKQLPARFREALNTARLPAWYPAVAASVVVVLWRSASPSAKVALGTSSKPASTTFVSSPVASTESVSPSARIVPPYSGARANSSATLQ